MRLIPSLCSSAPLIHVSASPRRMELMKQMREDNHGKYTEMSDEKLVIRTSA